MDTKAAFEKWFDENMYLAGQCFCTESEKRRMLKTWTASRSSIVIPSSSDSEYWFEGTFQRMRYERDVEKAIGSGIKVKS